MPISLDGKIFESFDRAVEHIRRTKKHISNPVGYVAEVERKQKTGQITCPVKLKEKIGKIRAKLAIISVGPNDRQPTSPKIRQNKIFNYMNKQSITPGKTNADTDSEDSALRQYIDQNIKVDPRQHVRGTRINYRKQFAQTQQIIQEQKSKLAISRNTISLGHGQGDIYRVKGNTITERKILDERSPIEMLREYRLNTKQYKETRPFYFKDISQNSMKPNDQDMSLYFKKQFAQIRHTIQEQKLALQHKHHISYKTARLDNYKVGELKESGKFWKYWLLNAKQTNGNGWGVSDKTIRQHISRFIGRPFVITDNSWIDNSEYGNSYEHPYLPTNNLITIFNHQAKFRVGDIVDIFEDNDDWYAQIKPLGRFANRQPPPFCSPGIFQLNPFELETELTEWEPLHLAGLDRDPAYGPTIAMLKGTCVGTHNECKVQFRGARQLKANIDDTVKRITDLFSEKTKPPKPNQYDRIRIIQAKIQQMMAIINTDVIKAFKEKKPLKGKAYSTDGNSFFLFGNEIARHSSRGLMVSDAGLPTAKTYDTLRALGVKTKISSGVTTINDKPYSTGKFVTIPYKNIINERVYLHPKIKRVDGGTIGQRKFRELSRENITGNKKGIPLSPTDIQPNDQELINSITGIKSPTGKEIKATETHHIFYKSKYPGLKTNVNNAIPLTRQEHYKLHRLNAKQRLALGIPIEKPPVVKINPEHGRVIADAYDQMKHESDKPEVKAAYGALINETKTQFNDLIGKGLKVDKIKEGMSNPYPTSREMHRDVEENNHLFYFPTEQGFGPGAKVKNHPMLQPTGMKHEGVDMPANDVFRIVHDINGHHRGGKSGFGPTGEHQAYLTHRKMFSPLANKALFTETAGQNNWVNFSKSHGEKNRADPKNTTYAEQKAGLLPDNIINGVYHQ